MAIDGDDVLPPGHPSLRPRGLPCFIDRDDDIRGEEARLRLALIAQVGGAAQVTTEEAHRAILAIAGVRANDVRVVPFYPENFLVICSTRATRDAIFHAGGAPVGLTTLVFRPWTRLANAEEMTLLYKVIVELEGLPPHAWRLKTARKILKPYCWIERADDRALEKRGLDAFRVTAWTHNPNGIPTDVPLFISDDELPVTHEDPEVQLIFGNLPPYLRRKKGLVYEVIVHLRSVADFSSRSPSPPLSPSPPSSDGDSGHDGHPDRHYGGPRVPGPRLQGFICRRGALDGTSGIAGAGAGAGNGRRNTSAMVLATDGRDGWSATDPLSCKGKAAKGRCDLADKPIPAPDTLLAADHGADLSGTRA